MPLALVKNPSRLPLTETEKAAVDMQRRIQWKNCSGRSIAFNTEVMKDHLTVSKALEMSNLIALLCEVVGLWYPFTSSEASNTFSNRSRPVMNALWFGSIASWKRNRNLLASTLDMTLYNRLQQAMGRKSFIFSAFSILGMRVRIVALIPDGRNPKRRRIGLLWWNPVLLLSKLPHRTPWWIRLVLIPCH